MADNKMDKLRNLKADNQLEAEELDQVAGGDGEQTDQDGWFLQDLMERAGMPDTVMTYIGAYYGLDGRPVFSSKLFIERKTVAPAWAALGVKMVSTQGDNQYFIDGKQVSREAAYMHVQKKTGVFL